MEKQKKKKIVLSELCKKNKNIIQSELCKDLDYFKQTPRRSQVGERESQLNQANVPVRVELSHSKLSDDILCIVGDGISSVRSPKNNGSSTLVLS